MSMFEMKPLGFAGMLRALAQAARLIKRRFSPKQTVVTYRLVPEAFLHIPLPETWCVETTKDPAHVGLRPSTETCHVLLVDGQVAGKGFTSVPPDGKWAIGETGTILAMPIGSLLLTAFWTVPRMRGQGVYSGLLSTILSEFFAGGGKEAYIGAVDGNHASHAAIRKLGFREHEIHPPGAQLGA